MTARFRSRRRRAVVPNASDPQHAWYARLTRKAGQSDMAQLTATIRGVERLHGDKTPLVKRFIREVSEALGVEEELHKTVKQLTER